MSNLGVGIAANDTYPLDVNGATRLSSTLSVGGASTLDSIADVTGTSKFTGNVGIGASPDPAYALYANGQVLASGPVSLNQSLTVGPYGEPNNATIYVKAPLSSTVPNNVVMNVPNALYRSIDSTNPSKTNKLEFDTKNHVIKPYIEVNGSVVTDSTNTSGWDLGATGANSFNRVYGQTLEVSKNMGVGKSSDAGYAMDVSQSLSLFVAVGTGTNTIATSPDGITWTGRGLSIFSPIGRGIASNDNQLVILDSTNTNSNSLQFTTESYYQEGYSNISISIESTSI